MAVKENQDNFGNITFPVEPNISETYGDPALFMLGSFLMSVLNDKLGKSWRQVDPSGPFVKTFQTDDPSDRANINEKDLPCLFLWRTMMTDDQATDDWTETTSDVTVLWVPKTAVQSKRSIRAPGINVFGKTITRALGLGRDPSWIDPEDPDPISLDRGSALIERANLYKRPIVVSTHYTSIKADKGTDIATYPALTCIIRISEITRWQDSWDSITSAQRAPTKLNETVTAGAFELDALIPTT